MKSPKVSVGIISYNHAAYLPFTIESVLSQTYPGDMEIIIVDDGSPDESLKIAQGFAEKHSNVRVVTHSNHVNRGISATCNLAITESRGEYIAIIGSDDIYLPGTIAEQTEFLDSNPDAGMVCGKSQYIDKAGDLLNQTFGTDISGSKCKEIIISFNKISAPSVMVRKACYDDVGLYDENLLYSDYDMWLRILLFSDWGIGYIDKFLVLYRIHSTNTSVGIQEELGLYRTLLVLLNIEEKLVENNKRESREYNLIKERITNQYYQLFCVTGCEGEIRKSMGYFAKYLAQMSLRELTVRRAASIAYRLPKSLIKAKW